MFIELMRRVQQSMRQATLFIFLVFLFSAIAWNFCSVYNSTFK